MRFLRLSSDKKLENYLIKLGIYYLKRGGYKFRRISEMKEPVTISFSFPQYQA